MSFDRKARLARMRLAGIGVLAVAVLAAGGVLAATSFGNGETTGKPQTQRSPSETSTSWPPSASKPHTPATGPRLDLSPYGPKSSSKGIGTGFEHSAMGATAAAVSYWENLDLLDDVIARKQWSTITSKDSPKTIDRGVSEVRKLREGVGLPPSGGTPDDITFTTSVEAALFRSLDTSGDVVDVWMVYDRYATIRGKGGDPNPLKGEVTNLIVTWEDGDWKVTERPEYVKKVRGPRAYHPNSKWAYMTGWRELANG